MPFLSNGILERGLGRGSGDICEFRGDISHIWRVARLCYASGLGNGWVLVWVGVLARWVRERDVHALFLRFHRFCVYCFVVGETFVVVVEFGRGGGVRCCAFIIIYT